MFDVLQIAWWFIQVTLVGFLCNYRVLANDTDRFLFAPISGVAALLIVSNAVWMWSFPTYLTSYILAASVGGSLLLFWITRPAPRYTDVVWVLGGVLLIALHGSIIPFDQKAFQGYPIDRIGYLAAYVQYQQEPLKYFTDAYDRLLAKGDQQVFLIHPMIGAALNEMKARTATGLSFISLAWLTPRDLHQLGNAWEVFLRAIQYSCVFALFSKALPGRASAGLFAVASCFGFWFQYMKDFNAWPHMATVALFIAIMSLLLSILNNGHASNRERVFLYSLAFAMVINHPEFGLVAGLGVTIVILSNRLLREQFFLRKAILAEGVVFICAAVIVHPYILKWLKHIFSYSTIYVGTEFYAVRNVYRLFGSDSEVSSFIDRVYSQPFNLLHPVAFGDMAIGILGLPYVAYVGGLGALGSTILLLLLVLPKDQLENISLNAFRLLWVFGSTLLIIGFLWLSLFKSVLIDSVASFLLGSVLCGIFWHATRTTTARHLNILFVLLGYQFVFFLGSMVAFRYIGILGPGSAYRSVGYWGIFASMALTLLLASSKMRSLRVLAVVFAALNVFFALSVNWVANHGGMERYADFYPNRDGRVHTQKVSVRDTYSFDYLNLVKELRRCNLVFLDFKDVEPRGVGRFQAAYLMIFLDNNRIPVRLGFRYLNGYQLESTSEFHPGFKKDVVNPDCVVDQELRDGRFHYRLTNTGAPKRAS